MVFGHDEWRVSYQFTDPDGVQQLGRQRLRNSGNLGSGTLHPLIHDERAYALHRLVVADDFLIP